MDNPIESNQIQLVLFFKYTKKIFHNRCPSNYITHIRCSDTSILPEKKVILLRQYHWVEGKVDMSMNLEEEKFSVC